MEHRVRIGRRLVRASIALVATVGLPGPSQASRAIATPAGGFYAHVSLGVQKDLTPKSFLNADVSTDTIQPPVKHPAEPVPEAVHRGPIGAIESPRSLNRLVRAFSETSVPDGERECLATAVYFEAQGEPIEGQLAVAEVVLNRAGSGQYPTSICEVVKQPQQFSFVRDGLFPEIDKSSEAWRTAVAVAHIAAEKLADELSSNVLWYHADYVDPSWGTRLTRVTQIGAHIFYSHA